MSTPDGLNPATVTTGFATFPPGVPASCDGFTSGLKTGCIASYGIKGSVIGGGTAGYNWQVGKYVTGLEGEFGYLHLAGSGPLPFIGGAACGTAANPCAITMSTTTGNVFGTLAARFGVTTVAFNPNWSNRVLLYGKVGAAVTKVATSEISVGSPLGLFPFAFTGSNAVWGVAAGGGVEWALNRHWSVKAEYEFLGFNKSLSACGILPVGAAGAGGTWCTQPATAGVQAGKAGFNLTTAFNRGKFVAPKVWWERVR